MWVYNHTAEGNEFGPHDRLQGHRQPGVLPARSRQCSPLLGLHRHRNSLNMRHPHVLQLIMDSLRYWIVDMHVDGFRFDLAATLARELHDVDKLSSFSTSSNRIRRSARSSSSPNHGMSARGATRSGTSLPCGPNGTASTETRCATSGAAPTTRWPSFAYRFTGSSDLYESNGRTPSASINFVT